MRGWMLGLVIALLLYWAYDGYLYEQEMEAYVKHELSTELSR
jgi:hypothetical protein